MPNQSMIWTVLPNGITTDDKSLRFSVLVSPRLDPGSQDPVLKSFRDFTMWPDILAGAKFTLLAGTKSIPLGPGNIDATIGTPDIKVWGAMFPDTTFVRKFVPKDRTDNTVVSYDTAEMYSTLSKLYSDLTVTANEELPSTQDLTSDKGGLAPLIGIINDIDKAFQNKKDGSRNIPKLFEAYQTKQFVGTAAKFVEFQAFHTPANEVVAQTVEPEDKRLAVTWQRHKRTTLDADKAVADIDFHQILSAMNPYPTLLRKLGIVLDFVVPRSDVPRGADIQLSFTAELPPAPLPPQAVKIVKRIPANPITHAVHGASTFTPASRPNPKKDDLVVNKGLIKLDTSQFSLLQADVDGGVHKFLNFARTLSQTKREDRHADVTTKLPNRAGAPALRNAGLMLVHTGRGKALSNSFESGKKLNGSMQDLFNKVQGASAGLYAEDLVRGWRIDILDKTIKKWRSLCERTASYDINKGQVVLSGLQEEGTIRLAATSSGDGSNDKLVFLHEAVAVWNGWSLVAQQPGKAVDRDEQKQRDAQADIPDGVRLKTSFVPAPGSLPRLRYGRAYAMRARAVDLAGNSLPPSQSDFAGLSSAADAQPYLRFEPVQPPGLALVGTSESAETPHEGESMSHVAVRSMNAQFDDPTPTDQKADRWAVAPRTSQREAEVHGMFDGNQWGTPQQFALLVERDRELAQYPEKQKDVVATSGPVIGIPSKKKPANPKNGLVAKVEERSRMKFAVLPSGATALPYLPDPLCTRVIARFRNHPSISAHTLIEIPLYDDGKQWPDVSPRMIHVYEDNSAVPHYDAASRTLLVPTPKGTRAKLHLSSMLAPDKLDLMGVWGWVSQKDKSDQLRQRAQLGRLWPLTPMRQIDVVHAVQRPLLQPDIADVSLQRSEGETHVTPTVLAKCHVATTDKVDLHGTWNDPYDNSSSAAPADHAKAATPFSIKITDPQGYLGIVEHLSSDDAPNLIAFGELKRKPDEATPIIKPKVHDFGDTRYRRVEYQLIGTTRFREYMPSDVLHKGTGATKVPTDENITLAGAPKVEWALNASSPNAPEVLYVVPMFGWTRGVDADHRITSWRKGGGLRVWLDRPWNTTGYGEMLAVALPPEGQAIEPNVGAYKQVATQWGNDPIWKSAFVKGVAPERKNFPLRRVRRDPDGAWLPPHAPLSVADQPDHDFPTQNLRYPGLSQFDSSGRVDIAPHDVYWDEDRRLWYCDIAINHGESYFPFVRLALARYQPCSLDGHHLSNIVMSDFASLTPDRSMSVTTGNPTRRGVRVFGFSHEQSSAYAEAYAARAEKMVKGKLVTLLPIEASKTNIIEVWVEKLTPEQGEDFGWHRISTGVESQFTEGTRPPIVKGGVSGSTKASKTPVAPRGGSQVVRNAELGTTSSSLDDLMAKGDYAAVLKDNKLEMAFEWPTLWDGHVDLPSAPSSNNRYRIVVAEYEEYLADGPDPYHESFAKLGRRIVFVEHVELT